MSTTLHKELADLQKLPETEQEFVAEQLSQWRTLRSAITKAREQVAQGSVAPLDAEAIIEKARAQHAGS